jgi:hypothetical protein
MKMTTAPLDNSAVEDTNVKKGIWLMKLTYAILLLQKKAYFYDAYARFYKYKKCYYSKL